MVCFTACCRRPLLANRILYYRDKLFSGKAAADPKRGVGLLRWAVILAVGAAWIAILAGMSGK